MAYTKLNLKDFIDKWDAIKVEHLEDGIKFNDDRLNKLFNLNSLTEADKKIIKQNLDISHLETLFNRDQLTWDDKDNIKYNLDIDQIESQLGDLFYGSIDSAVRDNLQSNLEINTIGLSTCFSLLSMYTALIANIGERVAAPTLTFNGDFSDKTFISIPTEELNGLKGGYVKISDDVLPGESGMIVGTIQGILPIAFIYLGIMFAALSGSGESYSDLVEMALMFGLASAFHMQDSEISYSSAVALMLNQNFPSLLEQLPFLEYPTIVSTENDMNDSEMPFSKGTWVLYLEDSNLMPGMPVISIDKIWDFENLNIHNVDKVKWDNIDFNNSSTLTFKNNKMMWDGISSLPSNIDYIKKVSTNPKKFFDVFNRSGLITVTYADGTSFYANFETDDLGKCGYLKNGDSVAMLIPLTFYEVENMSLAPGVYLHDSADKFVSEITCANVNVEAEFNKKIPIDKYECLAYEENNMILGKSFHYNRNDNAPIITIDDETYAHIDTEPLNTNIQNITVKTYEYLYESIPRWSLSEVDEYCPDLERENIIPFIWSTIPEDEYELSEDKCWLVPPTATTDQVVVMRLNFNDYFEYFNLSSNWYDNWQDYGYWKISEIGGPTNNPYPVWVNTHTTDFDIYYEYILENSYMYLAFYPNENFVNNQPSLWINNLYNDNRTKRILTNSETLNDIPIKNIDTENNRTIYSINDFPYIITDDSGTYLYSSSKTTSVDDRTTGLTSFVSAISCEDIIRDPIIHKIDKKFLPTAAAIADATGETVSADEFNALLTALRAAGYLAIE